MVTSNAVVGSSAIIKSGRFNIAIAIETRWRIPPENWWGKLEVSHLVTISLQAQEHRATGYEHPLGLFCYRALELPQSSVFRYVIQGLASSLDLEISSQFYCHERAAFVHLTSRLNLRL